MRRVSMTVVFLTACLFHGAFAADTATPAAASASSSAVVVPAETAPTADALQTAVALNYCRASFHRIRREPTRFVLAQEQDKILNNINLDGIADREVITLYTAVLDEINQIGIADYERRLTQQFHGVAQQRKFVWDVLAIGCDVSSGHYGDALRQGANSWWDFRTMQAQRESDLLKIDKARLTTVVQKSSLFLDTFWQMTQKKHIPDRWLVRGDDLDALDAAMRERDPEVRLRILKRMEVFMEAYPPYWYYVARTQQELGQLFAASNTYTRLVELGAGHFRRDDMLATALANKCAIQDYLGQSSCVDAAQRALVFSTDVWEANLVCARILQRRGKTEAAEDAILRNLDVNLETEQSRVFLVSLYESSGNREKLLQALSDPQVVAVLPAPVLLRCAARLGQAATPPHVMRTIAASIEGQPRLQFGADDFVLQASPLWLLSLATVSVYHQGAELARPEVATTNGVQQLRYAGRFEWGNPLGRPPSDLQFEVRVTYPDWTEVRMVLAAAETPAQGGGLPARVVASRMTSGGTLRIAQIEVGDSRTSSAAAAVDSDPEPATTPLSTTDIPLPPRDDDATR